jgi:hypothetical protein
MILWPTRWLPKIDNIADSTGARPCHTASVTTVFFLIVQQDLSYTIEVTKRDAAAYTEADAWVADRQFATKVADRWERLPDPDRQY